MVIDPPAIVIRPAARDFSDRERVRLLILDAFAYMGPRIDPPSSAVRLTPKSVQASAESGALLLAYSGGDLVGCLFLHQKNDALYISKLAVSPTLQRAGIGRKLVEAARGEARLRGIGMLELETRIELTENHAAFARMGFIKTAETSHEGFDRTTSIVMRAPVQAFAAMAVRLECQSTHKRPAATRSLRRGSRRRRRNCRSRVDVETG